MPTQRQELRRKAEYFSDDIGPLRAPTSWESERMTKAGKRGSPAADMNTYGHLGTTNGLPKYAQTSILEEYRKLHMSLAQENTKNHNLPRTGVLSRKCKRKESHPQCLGCACECHERAEI